MQWVEITAKTIEEAKDLALDELGVDEQEAEFEILSEPKPGLFGRVRGEARVRARIRPVNPRPKVERRERQKRRSGKGGERGAKGRATEGSTAADDEADTTDDADPADSPAASADAPSLPSSTTASPADEARPRRGGRGGRRPAAGRDEPSTTGRDDRSATTGARGDDARTDKETDMTEITLDQQGQAVSTFLEGLLDAFDVDGDVTMTVHEDDEVIEVAVEGDELGLLIGPKGQTLQAIQEVARAASMQALPGRHPGRVRIDVAGYRQRRSEALGRFARQVAEGVLESGTAKALEPMSAADRKVVHDTINEIDGVRTISEGEDPRRRVVIQPDD